MKDNWQFKLENIIKAQKEANADYKRRMEADYKRKLKVIKNLQKEGRKTTYKKVSYKKHCRTSLNEVTQTIKKYTEGKIKGKRGTNMNDVTQAIKKYSEGKIKKEMNIMIGNNTDLIKISKKSHSIINSLAKLVGKNDKQVISTFIASPERIKSYCQNRWIKSKKKRKKLCKLIDSLRTGHYHRKPENRASGINYINDINNTRPLIKPMPSINISEQKVHDNLIKKGYRVLRMHKKGYPDFKAINNKEKFYVEVKSSCSDSFTPAQLKRIPVLIDRDKKVLIAITCPDRIVYLDATLFFNSKFRIYKNIRLQ